MISKLLIWIAGEQLSCAIFVYIGSEQGLGANTYSTVDCIVQHTLECLEVK